MAASISFLHIPRPLLGLFIVLCLHLTRTTQVAASAPLCTAIFMTELTLLNGSVLVHLDQPAVKSSSSSKVCPNIPIDGQTCCSADSDQQIETITNNLITFRNSLADIAPSALLQSLFRHQPWLDLTPQHVQWGNLTLEQQSIVRQYINIVTPILKTASPCVDAVLTYIQGLLCLSCEVRAGDYFMDGKVMQTWRTCGYTYDVCGPVISSLVAALPSLLDLYIAFLLTLPSPLPPLASASLSQSYVLRAVMSNGIGTTSFCQSAWMGMFTGEYRLMHDCFDVVCTALGRGLDWDLQGWLGLTDSEEEDVIQLPRMKHGEGVTITAGGSHDGGHSAHRRLLSVVLDETDNEERLAAVSSFGTFSSVVGGLWSRFHVMHGGLHGSEDEMKEAPAVSTSTAPRIFPPAPASLHSAGNGHVMNMYGDDEDAGYYPLWSVGCASLEHFGVLCPMADERNKGHDKAVFLGIVLTVALLVGCAMLAVYRAWRRSGGGSDGGDGDEGLLVGVGKKMRNIKAGLGRRMAQRSRAPLATEEAEGILAE